MEKELEIDSQLSFEEGKTNCVNIKNLHSDMTEAEWKEAIRFDITDWGWIIMSIGMAIGAGIVFLPVQVGLVGVWVYLLAAAIGYPALYLFQRLFVNTLAVSPECTDYPSVISHYLGKNWGIFLGVIYFIMIVISIFVYSISITNDSASFLHSFNITDSILSSNPYYGLGVICLLVAIAAQGERILFKINTALVLTKLCAILVLGLIMVNHWDVSNVSSLPTIKEALYQAFTMLPLTLTSILFIQTLSPMVISYRSHNKSIDVAWHKSLRAMNISFAVLFITIFFFAISFNLAMNQGQAIMAAEQNISALAIAAQEMDGDTVRILSLLLNIFSIMTAFFGVFLAFKESCQGIALNVLKRIYDEQRINRKAIAMGTLVFGVLVAWGAIILNIPVLRLLTWMGPIMGIIGCFIPTYLVYKLDFLARFRSPTLLFIVAAGILLTVSPFV
ncbi:Inner membrane transport protein YhaO [Veillonella criceti]|uniref:Inner membrane transport protein YhaO n=2 Tax=Veillonella criceti TaxID=103891 RepID=A0A380NMX8_9FIRM|nr:Inner membrane transport protein YhaO [Veillonella criceti]